MKLRSLVRSELASQIKRQSRIALAAIIASGALALPTSSTCLGKDSAPEASQAQSASKSENIELFQLVVSPKAESKPALKLRFVLDDTEQHPGNAAMSYLKAMGFLEQNGVRDKLRELQKAASEQSTSTGRAIDEFPPYSYLEMKPSKYPIAEVKEYLTLFNFQTFWLRDAFRQRSFSLDRNLQDIENPIGYLLPEMQTIRELSRVQSIRCRLAIAENRIDDAIEIIGQQLTMSRHIAQDDFLICSLIASSVESTALRDLTLLMESPACPNLYWALAQLPDPLVDFRHSLAFERQFAYIQVPKLREIDSTTIRSEGYCNDLIASLAKQTAELDQYSDADGITICKEQGAKRIASMQNEMEENYASAKEYLLSRGIVSPQSVDKYPKQQIVLLAMKDFYEVTRDDIFKWTHQPFPFADRELERIEGRVKSDRERWGWFTRFASAFLGNLKNANSAPYAGQQRIAMVQAIEAIRLAAAENGGKLIESLDKAPVPVPHDPFTGKPFEYHVNDDVATISSKFPEKRPLRVELKLAK